MYENEKGEQSWVEEMLTHLKKNLKKGAPV